MKLNAKDTIWNILTGIVLLAMLIVVVVMFLVYQNPDLEMNPYPPPTVPAKLILPTSTNTAIPMPATWTAVPTQTMTATKTALPTRTMIPTNTPVQQDNVGGDESSSFYKYGLQNAPNTIAADILHPEYNQCNWTGVGGNVSDLQGRPVTGIVVQLGGVYDGSIVSETSLTGTVLQYGEAGYEFTLANEPFNSEGKLWVMLMDQSRIPLSPKIPFDTFEDCNQNLVVINFKQIKE
ncbi:MAG: hypothetical protein JEZ06_23435 [Anaerolineaceae bacterium]|nr:hypothetical protein [Anaerolineaceae bacterium]